ncbi:MAG: protein-L-isoaspartate(D-aspartate) O-methyltransferase [Acidobacteria bacterium]|nr:protein-L-isoaspartate(D-aspartate) O-methyltransferase [Acidobacteriota bacterium]
MNLRHPHALGQGMTSDRSRTRLIEELRAEGIRNADVLTALARVPRHGFVDEALTSRAYDNVALPIGYGQTISQPLVVAWMTGLLMADGKPREVLEIGTGSGYQTAVLAELGLTVYSTERIRPLHELARKRLRSLGYSRVRLRLSDGSLGLPDYAPFEAILVTAAAPVVPPALLEQLRVGGRLVMPVGGSGVQRLIVVRRKERGYEREPHDAVSFVPLLPGIQESE